jgi:predicted MFS family arabinose efflux permease
VTGAAPSHPALAPFRHGSFRRAFSARVLSGIGSWMQTVAAGWLIFELTGDAAAVGLLTALSKGPGLFLSPVGGQLADRFDRKRVAVVLAITQAIAAAILAALAWDGVVTEAEIYVCTLLIGVAGAMASPIQQDIVPSTVPDDERKSAVSLSSIGYNLARLAGPALGGVVVNTWGADVCFAVNAGSFLIMVVAIASLPVAVTAKPPGSGNLREAVDEARHHPPLPEILLGIGLFSLLVAPIQELAPALAREHGDSAHYISYLLSSLAAGGVVGNVLLTWSQRRGHSPWRMTALGSIVSGAALALLGLSNALGVAMAAMFIAGICWEFIWVNSMTTLQLASRPEMTGRMIGLFFALTLAAVTVGALVIGWIIDLIGPEEALVICGCGIAGYGVWGLRQGEPPPRPAGEPMPDPL